MIDSFVEFMLSKVDQYDFIGKQIHHENMINEIIAEVYCTGNILNGL